MRKSKFQHVRIRKHVRSQFTRDITYVRFSSGLKTLTDIYHLSKRDTFKSLPTSVKVSWHNTSANHFEVSWDHLYSDEHGFRQSIIISSHILEWPRERTTSCSTEQEVVNPSWSVNGMKKVKSWRRFVLRKMQKKKRKREPRKLKSN